MMTAVIRMNDAARLIVEAVVVTVALSTVGAAALFAFVQSRRSSPDAIGELVASNNELSRRVRSLEQNRERDHAAFLRIQLRVAELEIGVQVLIAQIRRLGETPEYVPSTTPPPVEDVNEAIDERAVQRSIDALFSVEEIDDLAFRVGIDVDDIEGRVGSTRSRSLVQLARRRGLLPELIRVARQLRPEGDI